MATAYPSQESRPLKKPRLGPPGVYPQEPKQKEDDLSGVNVKCGFNSSQSFDEYGSARSSNIAQSQAKVGAYLSSIIAKKTELNTAQDVSKKKLQINTKDNFWPVTPRTKSNLEAWFHDLAGNKVLKKVPIFNKKEEIFSTLCQYDVPMVRATWFIKMTSAYTIAMSENKMKKRQIVDPSLDWAQALTKFLKEQLQKISEHYVGSGSSAQTSFLTATQTTSQDLLDLSLRQWKYCTQLMQYMYKEWLLDRQDVLTWFVDTLDKLKHNEDSILKIVLVQVLQYVEEFTQSHLLSRRLAHFSAKKLSYLCCEATCNVLSPRTESPMLPASTNGAITASGETPPIQNPLLAIYNEYNNCSQHRSVILNLSAILQACVLQCPGALVWHNIGEGKSHSVWSGSPLDLLPNSPSMLPMPPGSKNQQIRHQLRAAEYMIALRSRAVEVRWSCDKWQQSLTGHTMTRVLSVLDTLDRHNFERAESNNCLDSLYNKIFHPPHSKDSADTQHVGDNPVIILLCEWAVSTQRMGEHRSVVVAKLLEKRQNELAAEKFAETDGIDEKESINSTAVEATMLPIFQSLLMQFLDSKAPLMEDAANPENKRAFSNLILLFCELIRHDVFSHDAYISTLISRGDLLSPAITATTDHMGLDLMSVKSHCESVKPEPVDIQDYQNTSANKTQEDMKMELENQIFDPEFDFFGSFKEEEPTCKTSPEHLHQPPASVKSIKSEKEAPVLGTPVAPPPTTESPQKRPSRHLQYATHFPVPQDDLYIHECNQRMIILYGVGKARDDARHIAKRITKEIMKLYSKKSSLDISSGDIAKRQKKKEREKDKDSDSSSAQNFESTFNKFQKLSYYDMHAVTSLCASSVLEIINSFVTGSSFYLPLVENISYLFDLMEYSLNINGLMDFVIQLLKELSEVEVQLLLKASSLSGSYTTSLCLCIVAVLRRYHAYLLASHEQTASAFEGLCGVVKHVGNPSDCTSAERCILAYLYDLYTSCSYLKAKFSEIFGGACAKVKQTLYASITPSASNLLWDPAFMIDLIDNAKSRPDPVLVKQLNENPANRYSFVCNALLNICNGQGVERLNEISILCAELTACCNALSSEWLGVLKALCCSSNHSCGFIDVLTQVDVGDLSIHDSLAVFTAILIARHCFSLQDLVVHVALHSLLAACPSAGGDQDAEPGARLTCHLLLRLFKTDQSDSTSPFPNMKNMCNIKASCDRHLLAAAHDSITVGAVLAVLKAILVLGDSCGSESPSKVPTTPSDKGEDDIISTLLSTLDNDIARDPMGFPQTKASKGGIESAGLSDFAKHALKAICAQDWVREKFLKDPESLFTSDLLLDNMLSPRQTQQLVHLICYPNGLPGHHHHHYDEDDEPEQKDVITRILKNLNQWTLRVSWLELQLMFKQSSSSDMSCLLEDLADSTIEVFQQQTDPRNTASWGPSSPQPVSRQDPISDQSVWLMAPLIGKLPNTVQGRVLKAAASVLESGNSFWSSKNKTEKERNLLKSTSLLGHQPFLSLVLNCLKGQDEQRENLLNSLHNQLEQFIQNAKEEKYLDDAKLRQIMQEALQLRLSLVGGMFDTIQKSNTNTTDWCVLLFQMIAYGVIDTQSNSELFFTIMDMLSVLIHGTLVSEGSEKGEENRKSYMNLVKKLKKEFGDRHSDGIDLARHILPFPKRQYEVLAFEAHGSLVDTKGNKVSGFDSISRKQGLQVSLKNKVSSWDLLEGNKNSGMLPLAWFGAVKLERKPLKYEDQHRILFYHTHSLRKDPSYYLDAPPLPPEDLEPPVDKMDVRKKEIKEESIQENRQPDSGGKRGKAQRRRRQSRVGSTSGGHTPGYMQVRQTDPVHSMPFRPDPPMYQPPGANGPPPQWYPPQQQPPGYFPQQQMPQENLVPSDAFIEPSSGPTFGNQINSQSKAALSTMLRARQPTTQSYMPNNPQQSMNMQMLHQSTRHQLIRQQLRVQQQQNNQRRLVDSQAMYGNQQMQGNQQPMPPMQGIPMETNNGMNQGYPGQNYNMQGGSMMDPHSGMMSPTFQQGYQGQNMPGPPIQPGSQNYMQQGPQGPGGPPQYPPHFNQNNMQAPQQPVPVPRGQGPGPGGPIGISGYNQIGPGPHPGGPRGAAYMQNLPTPQQQQQSRMRQMQQQRMMALQQQQKQQMQTEQQQQTAALVAQLQRQLSSAGQPPGPQPSQYKYPPQQY
ncbi:mediator of RNA polymerase II transcription subunit 12-like protein isoform X2 [Lineus longissimus]|uniref:mediator of RNA polymerase II transcription subunit 12-like protein isoform X2 n=1 Tax=Lineus longissimus TaxID=88925 RepID=UPI00315CA2D2